eukprot:6287940-Prymnesium_polylepis.1
MQVAFLLSAAGIVTPRACLRLRGAEFASDLLEHQSVTSSVYGSVPLATLATTTRGNVLKALARSIDEQKHADAAFADALAGDRVDGGRRGPHQAAYDWLRTSGTGSKRVACKSSQLRWNGRRWMLQCSKVKLPFEGGEGEFDELLVVLFTPRAVYVYRHDLQLGVSRAGAATAVTGHQIQLYAPADALEWAGALDELLARLDQSECVRLADVAYDDARMLAAIDRF